VTTFAVALVSAAVLVGVVRYSLLRLDILDVPNARSSHARPVPRGGGLAVLPCVALGLTVSGSWSEPLAIALTGAGALGVVGLVDDIRGVSARVRLLAQLVLTGTTAAFLLASTSEPGDLALPVAAAAATIWLSYLVNVYNFMDGANGVAGFMAAVSGGWFAYVGADRDVDALLVAGLGLLGASLGFLPWNYPRARVFLGDVGSYSIGMAIGCLTVLTLATTDSVLLAVAPVCVFLGDTTLTLVSRAARREPVMSAHREHAYQRLTAVPGSPWPAVMTTVASLACVVAAAALPPVACVLCWVGVLAIYMSLPAVAGRVTSR
jgi:UDP-GlcNAc:undecaprenyl-phosphate/decaprenyl-phosphate GlcNAc-1-phosphate transferase